MYNNMYDSMCVWWTMPYYFSVSAECVCIKIFYGCVVIGKGKVA